MPTASVADAVVRRGSEELAGAEAGVQMNRSIYIIEWP